MASDPRRRRAKSFCDPDCSSTMQAVPFGLYIPDLKKRYSIYHAVRRYVPAGHHDNVVQSGCCIRNVTPPRIREGRHYIDGPQHHPVTQRNVISGKIGPKDQILPPRCPLGPQLLAPSGHYNEDIIDHRFTPPDRKPPKLTLGYPPFKKEEIRDNVVRTNQACHGHAAYKLRTHAALTEFLYEAKDKAGEVFDKDEFSAERVSPKAIVKAPVRPNTAPAKPVKA